MSIQASPKPNLVIWWSRQSIGKVLNDWRKNGNFDIHNVRLAIKQLDIMERPTEGNSET